MKTGLRHESGQSTLVQLDPSGLQMQRVQSSVCHFSP